VTTESTTTSRVRLLVPAREHLDQYAAALRRGWSPDNLTPEATIRRELDAIAADPAAFVDLQVDREARGGPITLPDGSKARRLPGYRLWIWDGEFCGTIGLRWQPGTTELPPHVLGHVGYSVVPWKRRRGHATAALGLMLRHARAEGLEHVMVTTDPENLASRKVILANGGILVERFARPSQFGHSEALRYRVPT
jgi:predicted acetyltransferase